MTIHELLQAAGLTANDEIPIWDVDGTGEPTKKITAQQLASAVVALANLVTGVKGNAESSYRSGNVNLTPANIGAVATSDIINVAHGGTGSTTPNGARQNLGIRSGTKVSVFSGGSVSFAPSDIGLSGKPNCLILTLSSNASSNPPTYDTFLSYDWDASTESSITIRGYKANGTPIEGYMRYSFIAIP